ncbi:MAG: hypothetical protein JKY56_07275 [Kofleriaceae bacterium]|nr:hypothetical protein [Kofleriaceae bacterium]
MKRYGFFGMLVFTMGCGEPEKVPDNTPPLVEPSGFVDTSSQRRVRRLSAEQFHNSLQVATNQAWSKYERFAAALGRADFGETTSEGGDISVTFDKLVHDAARETCLAAVEADVQMADNVILRHVSLADRDLPKLSANLRYLFLRFLAVQIDADDDARFSPWLTLLQTKADGELSDNDMQMRWAAVCVGLVTHPDFLTY